MARADHLYQGTGYRRMDTFYDYRRSLLRHRGEYWLVHHAGCQTWPAGFCFRTREPELRGADPQSGNERFYQGAGLRVPLLHIRPGTRRHVAPVLANRRWFVSFLRKRRELQEGRKEV